MQRFAQILILALTATAAAEKFTIIDHDAVVPLSPAASDLELFWQPRLVIGGHACHSFPAVNDYGQISGGLAPRGGASSGCQRSGGQCYVRKAVIDGVTAIMYSWFFPKAEKEDLIRDEDGHRYSWQNVVVFLDDRDAPGKATGLKKICFSQTLDHVCYADSPAVTESTRFGNRVTGHHAKVKYVRKGTNLHPGPQILEPAAADDVGDVQPLVDWHLMPEAVRDQLGNFNWENGIVMPFSDAAFDILVWSAWKTAVTSGDPLDAAA